MSKNCFGTYSQLDNQYKQPLFKVDVKDCSLYPYIQSTQCASGSEKHTKCSNTFYSSKVYEGQRPINFTYNWAGSSQPYSQYPYSACSNTWNGNA
jgi:hypothetical protein